MIFDRLANFVVKRYVIIIIAWIIVIIYAFPLILNVNDVIAYQETEFLDTEFESQMAMDLISEQFPIDSANSSMLLVLVADDLSTAASRDFVFDLENSIASRSDISYLDEVISIYAVYGEILQETVKSLAPVLYQTEEEIAQSLQLLYGIPSGYFMAFEGVNATASIVYGIPSVFFVNWSETWSYPNSTRDAMADAFTSAYIESMISTQGIDPLNETLMREYYYAFNASWVSLGIASSYTIDPNDRLEQSVDLAIISFTGSLPPEYASAKQIMLSVHQNLSFLDYYVPEVQSDLSAEIVIENITELYGEDPSVQLALSLISDVNTSWKESFNTTPNLNISERSETILPLAHGAFLSRFSNDSEEFMVFSALVASFDINNYSNQQMIHYFVLSYIASEFGIEDLTLIESIYSLGPIPDQQSVGEFAGNIVVNGTIHLYPIPFPSGVLESFLSDDNSTMLIIVSFTKGAMYRESDGNQPIVDNVEIIRDIADEKAEQYDDIEIFVTGEAPINADLSEATDRDLRLIEPATIILVIVLMSIFFRSILTPLVPLGAIGIALGISQAMVFLIGSYVADVHFTVLTLLITVLFGVGTDYSIFILARYREERLKDVDRDDAMRTSITWAGESIATSGATVMISFGAISISTFAMLRTMGLVIALAVFISLLIALTLVPAIALLIGKRLFWPTSGKRWVEFRQRYFKKRAKKRGGYFRQAARISVKHAWPIFIIALLISVPATYAYLNQETSFDFIGGMAENESTQGLEAMSESFGAGRISPTQIAIQFQDPVILQNGTFDLIMLDLIEEISMELSEMDNIHELSSPTRPDGVPISYENLPNLREPEKSITFERMSSMIGQDNRTVLFELVFSEEPFTISSMDTIENIRQYLSEKQESIFHLWDATILVGGETAAMVDVDDLTSREFDRMQILVIIGVFLILLIVLGSIVLPLFAILSIALSISWTLATTLLVFDIIFDTPVLWLLPVVLFVVLMGLGMDYNIFILTRVREEMQKRGNHAKAIVEAVDRTGGIITACALIMGGAFGTMMLSSTSILQQFGFALAFAVLLDAMFVRTYLMPAIMKILGPRWTWWAPGRMQRVKLRQEEKKSKDDSIDDI